MQQQQQRTATSTQHQDIIIIMMINLNVYGLIICWDVPQILKLKNTFITISLYEIK